MMETQEIKKLLDATAKITDKYETIAKSTGSKFNVFEIANINENEVRMCRVLAELLDPNGTHCQGRIYLDLFFKLVLNADVPSGEVKIEREKAIADNRRIDILIKSNNCTIPIEVKINAGDMPNQLYDYSKKSRGIKNPKVYYLTKFGTVPSEGSCCSKLKGEKLNKEEVGCISWEIDILKWLEACLSHKNTIVRAPIREVLLQFASTIRTFTGQLEENERMEIEQLLLESPENMENAYTIESAIKSAEIKLWNEFCKAVQEGVKENLDILPAKNPDEWNIIYNLNETNENSKIVVWINSDKKKEIKKLSCKELFSRGTKNEGHFSCAELANKKLFTARVEECVDWITKKQI